MQFSKEIESFIVFLQQKGRSASTLIAYRKDIEQLSDYLSLKNISDLSKINADVLKSYLFTVSNELGFSAKTVSRKINSIRTFLKYLLDNRLISLNFISEIKHPKIKSTPPRVLSSMEYRTLRDIVRTNLRLYTIVELLLQTGMTIGELSRLKISDVKTSKSNFEIFIEAFSSKKSRSIILNQTATLALKTYFSTLSKAQKESNYLFVTKSGRPILIRNIRTAIDRAFKRGEIKNAKVNDIRNTFIINQLNNGVSLEVVGEYVGHQKPSTTERYKELASIPSKKKSLKILDL